MRKAPISTLFVRAKPGQRTRGWLMAGPLALPVALGRGGIKANKREGDGGTPRGTFRLRRLWWRADRAAAAATLLPVRRIRADDGWCEDPRDRHYNQPVRLAPDQPGDRLRRARSALRFHHRARPQHPAAGRRPRQRRVRPCRPAGLRADRGLRGADGRRAAAAGRPRRSAHADRDRLSSRLFDCHGERLVHRQIAFRALTETPRSSRMTLPIGRRRRRPSPRSGQDRT